MRIHAPLTTQGGAEERSAMDDDDDTGDANLGEDT